MLSCQRALFDIPADVTYLNCAYISPLLKHAALAGVEAVERKLHPWEITAEDFFTLAETARGLFARLIEAGAGDIAIVPSTSYGMALAARNLPLARGQKVLMLADEFPSAIYAWQREARETGAEIAFVPWPENGDWTAAICNAIDARTAIVASPACHWTNGLRIDLVQVKQACRAVGAKLVVDGTQSIGALPFSIAEIQPDFAVTAAYKWMMGPYAYGFCYVAPEWQQGEPLEENWLNREGSEDFANLVSYRDSYQPGARRFDMGERSHFMLAPVAIRALEQLLAWTPEAISSFTGTLTYHAAQLVEAAGIGAPRFPIAHYAPHMIGLRLNQLPATLPRILAKKKMYASIRGQSLRISPHVYNTQDDITRLIACLEEALRR